MSIINDFLVNKGVKLEKIGLNEYALSKQYALMFIDILKNEKIPILGGDVYYIDKNYIHYTYDNWYIQRESNESYHSYLNRSINFSREYINKYTKANINEVSLYFVFVFEHSDNIK